MAISFCFRPVAYTDHTFTRILTSLQLVSLRSCSSRGHVTLPGERCVTSARAAAKETTLLCLVSVCLLRYYTLQTSIIYNWKWKCCIPSVIMPATFLHWTASFVCPKAVMERVDSSIDTSKTWKELEIVVTHLIVSQCYLFGFFIRIACPDCRSC